MSRQQSLEQQRAAAAWDAIKSVPTNSKKDYVTVARDAPTCIQTNGLGQALAFWRAKKHWDIYKHVSGWVIKQLKIPNQDLMEWIIKDASSQEYRHATNEAIAYLVWLKRFAQAQEEDK